MKLFEIFKLPAMASDVKEVGNRLTFEFREIAAKHGITIDGQYGMGGNSSYHNKLPIFWRDFMLFGGQLLPRGGHRQEEKRTTKFEDRVKDFLKDLHKRLLLIQVHGLTGDLDYAHQVYIGHKNVRESAGLHFIEDMSAEQWFDNLPWKERNLRGISCTWAIKRTT